jgi:hypothetical protein
MSIHTYKNMGLLILISYIGLSYITDSNAQTSRLIARIYHPEKHFEDERKNWIGCRIYFLPCQECERRYFDFCFDPDHARKLIPRKKDLEGKYAHIREVWFGRPPSADGNGNGKTQAVYFWKLEMEGSKQTVWYWENGHSLPLAFAFWKDYSKARKHIADTLWTKDVRTMFSLDGQSVHSLLNTRPVILTEVDWGEFGNFPLKFLLKTSDGIEGYLTGRDFQEFHDKWHSSDPRKNHPKWDPMIWYAIENRNITNKMNQEMVRLSWGPPKKITLMVNIKGEHLELWFYAGVSNSMYVLTFKKEQLIGWQSLPSNKSIEEVKEHLRSI